MSAWRRLRILFAAQAWKIWDFHQLEQRVTEVAQFYSSSSKKQLGSFKGSSIVKDREKEKQITSSKKHLDPNRREAASTKRMLELMRQFSTILGQITQHKWAWPFTQPVDVEGLGLHDYYETALYHILKWRKAGSCTFEVNLSQVLAVELLNDH